MFVSMGPFVPAGSPAGGHSRAGGRILLLAPWFYFQRCLATLVRLLLAISPFFFLVSLLSFSSLL